MYIYQTACAVMAFVSVIVGLVMISGGFDILLSSALKTNLQIKEGSKSYYIWKDTPVPMISRFYFYNLTNPQEFVRGAKPKLHEVGPYAYREYHEKTGINFNSNDTVSYFQKRWWVWDQEESGDRTPDDIICILNTVPVSAAHSVQYDLISLKGINMMFNQVKEPLTVMVTVREALFDGYEDPVLAKLHEMFSGEDAMFPGMGNLLGVSSTMMDFDKMAWFYKRNGTSDLSNHFNMFTGADDINKLGKIDWWNQVRNTPFFSGSCNRITGSAGEIWPPHQDKTNITFYSTDLCMSMSMPFIEEIVTHHGTKAYRYQANDETFGHKCNGTNNCYCYNNSPENCPLKGLLDAQTCRMGSPSLISFPHYLYGDPALFDMVEGLKPPKTERDQMYMDMIPELGIAVDVKARMQININLKSYPGYLGFGTVDLLADVPNLILPLLWFEVDTAITDELAEELKPVLFLVQSSFMNVLWTFMIFVGIIGVIFIRANATENNNRSRPKRNNTLLKV